MAHLLLALITLYQRTLSRLLYAAFGPICRFEPSCSRYAAACVRGHGALRGSLLSIKRVSRCHPFHPGGWDPPPPPRGTSAPSSPPVSPLGESALAPAPTTDGPRTTEPS
jgi:putative membrane protein insertion efficiency factor